MLIKNAMVQGKQADVRIEKGVIAEIAPAIKELTGEEVLDACGKTLLPAFVDMHVHLRDPGLTYKEDIASGSRAAVAGGFSAVACMPNTSPVNDCAAITSYIKMRGKEVGLTKVYPVGCISKGMKGEELAGIGGMQAAGAVAVSDDGKPVENANLMRHAMEYASDFDMPVLSHCEDKPLAEGGSVNEGYYSTLTGLKGIPAASEEVMVAREILLAQTLGLSVHLCHISTKGSVELIRHAKAQGVRVTAETCPHYFAADDSWVEGFDTNTKMNPPLRSKEDVAAIIRGIQDGTIDAIVTDHAPHHQDDKLVEYHLAAFGISGLETSFALCYTYLVKTGLITLERLSELMTKNPAEILRIPYGRLEAGAVADLVLIDESAEWQVDKNAFFSKGKNTPFHGKTLTGKVYATVVEGEIKYQNGKITEGAK
ncbi:MAG: dihydroorotase [Clostridia bacterium]|nr:dihydroorotase [Clostridia bacterium]